MVAAYAGQACRQPFALGTLMLMCHGGLRCGMMLMAGMTLVGTRRRSLCHELLCLTDQWADKQHQHGEQGHATEKLVVSRIDQHGIVEHGGSRHREVTIGD